MNEETTITVSPYDAVIIIGEEKMSIKIPNQDRMDRAHNQSVIAVALFSMLKDGNDELYELIIRVISEITVIEELSGEGVLTNGKQQGGE